MDIDRAIENLEGHSICLCKGKTFYFSDKKGIAPILDFIDKNINLKGFCVADVIVGKAAAMLFKKVGIKEVFGRVMSISAKEYLHINNIKYSYNELVEKIINRQKTDICPMEKTVLGVEDEEEAYVLLKQKVKELRDKKDGDK